MESLQQERSWLAQGQTSWQEVQQEGQPHPNRCHREESEAQSWKGRSFFLVTHTRDDILCSIFFLTFGATKTTTTKKIRIYLEIRTIESSKPHKKEVGSNGPV